MDTYFRGNSQELAFCESIGAGGNHLAAATAGGQRLGGDAMLRLRETELRPALAEYHALPEEKRIGGLPDPADAAAPKRPLPKAPEGGLVLRGYCCYLKRGTDGAWNKAQRFYYELNPDRWAAETQTDMLWLTRQELRSLAPRSWVLGETMSAPEPVRTRFFGTIGIDYMEGSVNALPVRSSELILTVEEIRGKEAVLQVRGVGHMGIAFEEHDREAPNSRGCEVEVAGKAVYDAEKGMFTRFDVAGVGKAWGNKMEYVRREIGIGDYPWRYGIAWKLTTGDSPMDRIPPYNLLHYGTRKPYFGASDP
ncbi:MAG TPA: hypothetical protein VMN36_19305 [Verrucomicrobiales bacterium]|nr:hypothetical protein [Verrucomicrobiales bacterium]